MTLLHPSRLAVNPYEPPAVTGHEEEPYVAGYLSRLSVTWGEPLDLHAATRSSGPCFAHVYRVTGCADAALTPALELVADLGEIAPLRYPPRSPGALMGPGDADADGCDWPAVRVLDAVPRDWRSGLYVVQVSGSPRPSGRAAARLGSDVLLIVRPDGSAGAAAALLQVNVGTWGAYHLWRDRSLYVGRAPAGEAISGLRGHRASYLRPGMGLGLPNATLRTPAPPKAAYALAFIDWLERSGLEYDLCSGLDIAEDAIDLSPYSVVLSIGHDEYWTRSQRQRLVDFRDGGGHLAFLGGNLAYWQIRHDPQARAIECHKRAWEGPVEEIEGAGEPLDPRYPADVDELTVQTWSTDATPSTIELAGVYDVQRRPGAPSELLFAGGMWWWEEHGGPPRPSVPFVVARPDHWAFAGTGLRAGDELGGAARIVGHEADGLEVRWDGGRPELTFADGALPGTQLLATADCRAWSEAEHGDGEASTVPGRTVSSSAIGGVVTMICHEPPGRGILFTAPTTEWVLGLVDSMDWTRHDGPAPVLPADPQVERITRNVLERLGVRSRRSNEVALDRSR